jgi:hypothetical protein
MGGRDLESRLLAIPKTHPEVKRYLDRAMAKGVAGRIAARLPDLPGRRIAHDPTARADVIELLDAFGLLPHPLGARMHTTALSKTAVADLLDKAADVIDRNGHHQGYLYDETKADDGLLLQACPVDAVGAINTAVFGKPRWPAEDHAGSPLAQAATLALEETVGKPVPGWNDEPGRTSDEVITALWETAERLRKETA